MSFKLGNPGCPCCDESDPPSEPPSDSLSISSSFISSSCSTCVCSNAFNVVFARHYPATTCQVTGPPASYNCGGFIDSFGRRYRENWSRPAFNVIIYAVEVDIGGGMIILQIPEFPTTQVLGQWTFTGWTVDPPPSGTCTLVSSNPPNPSASGREFGFQTLEGTGGFQLTVVKNTRVDDSTISIEDDPLNCTEEQIPPIYVLAPGEEWAEF